MILSLKPGVSLAGLCPQIAMVVSGTVVPIFASHGVAQVVITSANDGSHGANSLHFAGQAVDIRSKNIADVAKKRTILSEMKVALGVHFDVLLENLGGRNEHYHIEYQPRGPGWS